MIQRIQSLYLLIGAAVLASLFAFGSPWTSAAAESYGWFEPVLVGLIFAPISAALGSIAFYKKRAVQRTMVLVTQGLTIGLAATLYGTLYASGDLSVQSPNGINLSKTIMLVLPLVAYIFFRLAQRGIEHDIKLIEDEENFRLRG